LRRRFFCFRLRYLRWPSDARRMWGWGQHKAALFLEEMLAVLVTPAVLWFSLPASAHAILTFVRDFSVRVEGVGDVCSLSVFDFVHHGNARYASPVDAPKERRSNQVRFPELSDFRRETTCRPPKAMSNKL